MNGKAPKHQEEALTTMDGLINAAVEGQVVLIAVDAQPADVNRLVKDGLVNARLDVETLVFLEFARAHFKNRVAHARRPKVDLGSHCHGFGYSWCQRLLDLRGVWLCRRKRQVNQRKG